MFTSIKGGLRPDRMWVKLLSRTLLDELVAKAAASPRARAHHNLHAGPEDPVQRFVVAARANSYFRPHRHAARAELAVIVRGRFDEIGKRRVGKECRSRWSPYHERIRRR